MVYIDSSRTRPSAARAERRSLRDFALVLAFSDRSPCGPPSELLGTSTGAHYFGRHSFEPGETGSSIDVPATLGSTRRAISLACVRRTARRSGSSAFMTARETVGAGGRRSPDGLLQLRASSCAWTYARARPSADSASPAVPPALTATPRPLRASISRRHLDEIILAERRRRASRPQRLHCVITPRST